MKTVDGAPKIGIFLWGFLLAALVLSGCSYDGALGEVSCDSENLCPSGSECISGYCLETEDQLDSGGDEPDVEVVNDADVVEEDDADGGVPDVEIVECTDNEDCESFETCADNECVCNELRSDDEICAEEGNAQCGEVTDSCGATVSCGNCAGTDHCLNRQCVDCIDRGDCGVDEICSANECILDVECNDANPCAGDDQACVEGSCTCSESRSDADVCTEAGAQCGRVTDVCNVDITCPGCSGGEVCDGNQCVECVANTDCAGECSVCNGNNQCEDSNAECGDCESCAGGACSYDCGNEEACLAATSTCVQCTQDSDCIEGACSADNICVECTSSEDHCSGCEICTDDNLCVDEDTECSGCETCSDSVCNDDDGECPDGVCSEAVCLECTTDGDCGLGEECAGNECVPCSDCVECNGNGQCDGCETCEDGFCVDNDSECTNDPELYCSESDCVECSTDSHCSGENGWYPDGDVYECCGTGILGARYGCTCQDYEYRTYTCGGGICEYEVTQNYEDLDIGSCSYCGFGGTCDDEAGTCD